MKNKNELFQKILEDLKKTGGIDTAAICDRDGLMLGGVMLNGITSQKLIELSTVMHDSVESITAELNKGLVKKIIVETEDSKKLITVDAGPEALLVFTATPEAGLGLILKEAEKAAEKIKEVRK